MLFELTGEFLGNLVILAAMAQEDARHRVISRQFARYIIAPTTLMRIHDSIRGRYIAEFARCHDDEAIERNQAARNRSC